MPHCVLVLRLIGYSFNIYDGTQPDENLSNENQLTAIKTRPNFLEYCGFMCFPASFLVGPQFPYKRYENLVNGNYRDSVSLFLRHYRNFKMEKDNSKCKNVYHYLCKPKKLY